MRARPPTELQKARSFGDSVEYGVKGKKVLTLARRTLLVPLIANAGSRTVARECQIILSIARYLPVRVGSLGC